MLSPATARFAVGVLGNIISLFLYLSPVPTFIDIWRKGSVDKYSATTYLVTFLNAMLWSIYGMPFIQPNNILVSTIAGIGLVIELVYLTLFVIYSDGKKKKLTVTFITLAEILAVGIALAMVLFFAKTSKRRALVIGLLGDVSGVVMYAAPLSVMRQVIRTKSVEFMPLAISVTSFANALVWTLYAIHPLDPYVAIPNGTGCILGLAQLILYATYYKSTKAQIAARKATLKLEMGLKEVVIVTKEPNKVNSLPPNDVFTPKIIAT
ncbi:bidirectional sugar transporter SWEET4-like [Silene latifolia]|uniref:bidirectional sugar transporter SWEET4-like n=1 Tax=Silene latifolia TaxID=37657 RepID=UPI003D780AFA